MNIHYSLLRYATDLCEPFLYVVHANSLSFFLSDFRDAAQSHSRDITTLTCLISTYIHGSIHWQFKVNWLPATHTASYIQFPHTGRYNNKPHHLTHTVTVRLPNTVTALDQVPLQYAQHTGYIGCDLQIGQCGVSGSYRGVSVSVPVGILEDEASLRQVTVRVIQFSPVSIIPTLLHTHLHLHVALYLKENGRILGTFNPLYEIGKRYVRRYCNFCCVLQWVGHV